jgi:hypothetical protein
MQWSTKPQYSQISDTVVAEKGTVFSFRSRRASGQPESWRAYSARGLTGRVASWKMTAKADSTDRRFMTGITNGINRANLTGFFIDAHPPNETPLNHLTIIIFVVKIVCLRIPCLPSFLANKSCVFHVLQF